MSALSPTRRLVIFARPNLAPRDRERIETYRARHDPQHRFVEAHFTLVFPFETQDIPEAVVHAERISSSVSPIKFRLNRNAVHRDPLLGKVYAFLLPDEGAEEIRALHALLHTGPLAQHLNKEISYSPHVTVGIFDNEDEVEAAAKELGGFEADGKLTTVDVAHFADRKLTYLKQLTLGV